MATPDIVEQAIVAELAGRIDRSEAILRVRSALDLTELGALDLIEHPVAPRALYHLTLHRRIHGVT